MTSVRIREDDRTRDFLTDVLRRDSGGAYGVIGFVRLAEFVEAHPDIWWSLGGQSKEPAYTCRLRSDPTLELFRANCFGSLSFSFWRRGTSPLASDSGFRERVFKQLKAIPTTTSELDRREAGFNLRFSSIAGEAEFAVLAEAIEMLVARCLASEPAGVKWN